MSGTTSQRLRLWCRRAQRVELVSEGKRTPLERDGDVFTSMQPLAHGQRYALSLDGGEPLPDPRSPDQPEGVHAASRHVDPATFRWSDHGFRPTPLDHAVIYELHVGTFSPTGDFAGASERLDHLVALGVTHVELLPVAAFPGARGWGYDGVGLFAVHSSYGGPEGLARFVDACHGRGLAVILDVVYNHLGPEGNYLARFAPYFSWRHRTPWGEGLNLDEQHAGEVRRFVCDNAARWIRDFHIDGLRLDATHALIDTSAVHILEAVRLAVDAAGESRGIQPILIAESLTNDPRIVEPLGRGGVAMDAQWSDDFHHALHAWLTGEQGHELVDFGGVEPLARCLEQGWHLDGRHCRFRDRPFGRPPRTPPHTLVSYCQNHDQVGNRAHGERLVSLVGRKRAKIAAALTLLGPGIPMLFMGEEIAATSPFLFFTDFGDGKLGRAVERGRRREMVAKGYRDPPNPQAEDTFRRSQLRWEEADADMLAWYRALIALRNERLAACADAYARVTVGPDSLRMERGDLVVLANLGDVPVALSASPLLGELNDGTVPPEGVGIGSQ